MTTDTKYSDGDIVEVSRRLTDDEKQWITLPHQYPDSKITIEQFFEAGDPEQGEIPVDFYEAIDEHGCTVVVPADAVQLVMTAAQAHARTMPSPEKLAKELQGGLTSEWSDTVDIDETVRSGAEIECYGRTTDGLTFGFTVTFSEPWRTYS